GEEPTRENHGSSSFGMGFRVRIDPEIDRTKEEQDENRYQSAERQHPELPFFEFEAAGSELPSGPRPPSRTGREIAFPSDPTARLGGPVDRRGGTGGGRGDWAPDGFLFE